MEYLIIGLILGAILAYLVYDRLQKHRKDKQAKTQSVVLLERIRKVCKLVTVEGDFSEVYHYEHIKEKWFKLIKGKKKALVLTEGRVLVGFDLTRIELEADTKSRTIFVKGFPQPEILSVDSEIKFYDKQEGWANPFTAQDITEINKEAKQQIKDQVPGSGLLEEASKQGLETIQLLERITETINWKLDYSALEIESKSPRHLQQHLENND